MPSATVTESSGGSAPHVAVHKIAFNGVAGTLFWCNIIALILYTLGFGTIGWQMRELPGLGTVWVGLWHTCTCTGDLYGDYDWFHASQAMFSIGMIGLILCTLTTIIYMFFHKMSKNLIIMTYATLCFLTVIFMSIGLITFGVKASENYHGAGGLNFSYALAAVGTILCLLAGILSLVQMWNSNVV